MKPQTVAGYAIYYLSRGWSVIPLRRQDKRPAIRWLEYQHRLAGEDEAKDWFHRWPEANVGIVTGGVSGLVVLDVDPKHGGDASLEAMDKEHGPLPRTIEATTGGGGRHIYLAHPGGIIHNKVGLAPGIDLRGDGGCVAAPPSLHASGRRYVWAVSHEPDSTALAPMPGWLLREVTAGGRHVGHPISHWRHLVTEGVPEGERNNTIASLAGHLLWNGVDPDVTMELLLCWNLVRCRPPLPDDEVVRTVKSITRLHMHHGEHVDPSVLQEDS
ncbi:MAG: bifunctional DNA primase/polymerase [Desulfobacterales bacterium]|nr:bifunctional DNA primase/polymerase [Desulfobacterales bacterium]